MVRKAGLVVALALLLTCGPTAVTTAPSVSPSASVTPIASTDLITLREGGQQPKLVVRKVATADVVRELPNGMLLPDRRAILSVTAAGSTTSVTIVDRLSGGLMTREIPGIWQLVPSYPTYTGASSDGTHLILAGNSYNFTDQNGAWTAKTTFGVLDLVSWRIDPIELPGHYGFEAVSNDGRLLYLAEYTQNDARTRVYDTRAHELRDITGGEMISTLSYAAGYAFGMVNVREQVTVRPDVIQVTTVNKLARLDLASGVVALLPLPLSRTPGFEDSVAWSFLATRDGRTLYAVNPLVAIVEEIDLGTFQLRRSVPLSDGRSDRGVLGAIVAAIHPVAAAKMEFLQGAVFSPDESKIYTLAVDGIWSIDVASLKATMLARSGAYQSLKVSPDGARLYVLSREAFGSVSAIDAQTGAMIGTMKKIAAPSDIVAVDAG